VVRSVSGDVALTERVETEEVVEAGARGVEISMMAGEVMGRREHDQVVEIWPLDPQSHPSAGAYG
jgi:hypothetical protein